MKAAMLMTLESKVLMFWILIVNGVFSLLADDSGMNYAASAFRSFVFITLFNFIILKFVQRAQK